MDDLNYLLEVPRLRIQNANAISSPLTWGFPAMTAFTGLMHALERELAARDLELAFEAVGVICHAHEPQASRGGSGHRFHLTRNPVNRRGETAAIVEEGRIHLDITLVFAVDGPSARNGHASADPGRIASTVDDILPRMRVAGGSIQPPAGAAGPVSRARLIAVEERDDERRRQARRLLRGWLPGFGLVLRDDLLHAHAAERRAKVPGSDLIDAWLDLARLNMTSQTVTSDESVDSSGDVEWVRRGPAGWIVPIPVGYGGLGPLHEPGTVEGARDEATPLRFVESLYSVGEWRSPHRLDSPADLLWYVDPQGADGLYRLRNEFADRNPEPNPQ